MITTDNKQTSYNKQANYNEQDCYGFLGRAPSDLSPLLTKASIPLLDTQENLCGAVFGNTELLHDAASGELCRQDAATSAVISWNRQHQTLTATREFHGLWTVFYFEYGGVLYFSTSLKILLQMTSHIPKTIFMSALAELALLGRIVAPHTLYKGVKHLYAGQVKNWQFSKDKLQTYNAELEVKNSAIDELAGSFILGEHADVICSPFSAEVRESESNRVADIIAELATPSNIENFKELPSISAVVFEPIADIGILLYAEILKKRVQNIRWNFVADLLGHESVFDERLSYLQSITRRKYKSIFIDYWVEERYPEIVAQTENIRSEYDSLTNHSLSNEGLVRLSVIAPERLRNMKMLQQLYAPNQSFSVESGEQDAFQTDSFQTSLKESFFSDQAMEAGNLFSQFSTTELIAPTLGGTKFSTILSLSPLEKRMKLTNISQQNALHLERCLCGVMSADFLWRFYA